MARSKLPHPVAVCNVCRGLTRNLASRNQRCDAVVHGRRCSGTYKSGTGDLWDACDSCEATGKVGSQPCGECAGFGWKFYG